MNELTIKLANHWHTECRDPQGSLVWEDDSWNLIPRQGGGKLLTDTFASTAYTSAWYLGLVNTGASFATTDTHASHAGWTELTNYVSATRPAITFPTLDITTNVTSITSPQVTFVTTGSGTAAGIFLSNVSTKGSTAGGSSIIYGEVAFSGGDKVYLVDYLIICTLTLTATVS